MLRLPRALRLVIRALFPFALRRLCVELHEIGKLLPRLENARFDRLFVYPLLHNAGDVDGDELEIGRQPPRPALPTSLGW